MLSKNSGLIIVGAGGHAKVVLSVAEENNQIIKGYLDDNPNLLNHFIGRYKVIDTQHYLEKHSGPVIFGLGDNVKRKTIAEKFINIKEWKTLVHPSAYVHPSVVLGEGTVVFAGAVIQPNAIIGKHCIINTGTTIDHDCVVGDYAHLAPGVHLAGGVNIGEGAFLGIGSVVIPQIKIGEWVKVAAGAAVINNIPARQKVMGVPAKEYI